MITKGEIWGGGRQGGDKSAAQDEHMCITIYNIDNQ